MSSLYGVHAAYQPSSCSLTGMTELTSLSNSTLVYQLLSALKRTSLDVIPAACSAIAVSRRREAGIQLVPHGYTWMAGYSASLRGPASRRNDGLY